VSSENRQRNKQVAVRLSDKEYEVLTEMAELTGKSQPALLRESFLASARATALRFAAQVVTRG
jgi:predicted DNA-binding protein